MGGKRKCVAVKGAEIGKKGETPQKMNMVNSLQRQVGREMPFADLKVVHLVAGPLTDGQH